MKQIGSIALATYVEEPSLTPSDKMLENELASMGMKVVATPWDDERISWQSFDAVVLRSCWDYHSRPDEFIKWINSLKEKRVNLINDYDLVLWNIHKAYLLELKSSGIKIVPTVLLKKSVPINSSKLEALGHSNIVAKPSIGASAYEIFSGSLSDESVLKKLNQLVNKQDVLIQPLMEEAAKVGEYSSVFFNKSYSHTILKKPRPGDFRSNYEQGGSSELFEQSKKTIEQVEKIVGVIQPMPLYARVDYLLRGNDVFLMELELIEPSLYMDLYPPAAKAFAKEIDLKLKGSSPSP